MGVLERFSLLVGRLLGTASRLEKEAFLTEFNDDKEVKAVLHFLYNPYIVTGISDKKLGKVKPLSLLAMSVGKVGCVLDVLEYFKENNTGRDKDVDYLHNFAGAFDDAMKEIIYGLIKKSLKLGIQEKTLNKVFGEGFIPVMNVMLAERFEDNIDWLRGQEFIVTQKLDGVRAVLMFQNDAPVFFSRGGRQILDLVELCEEAKALDMNFVYDGELLLSNPPDGATAAEVYRATVKVTASDDEKRGIDFNIFDKVSKEDFVKGISEEGALSRKRGLEVEVKRVGAKFLKPVPVLYTETDVDKIPELLEKHTQNGEEGLMINPKDSPYECKRTKNLLKVKKFHTADVLVLSIEEGSGANKGKLGAVHVKFIGPDGKDHTCKVGSGFKQDEREHYFANQDEILGKIIEIGYFELSKNQNDDNYSLRFPTFKQIRDDKDEISMY